MILDFCQYPIFLNSFCLINKNLGYIFEFSLIIVVNDVILTVPKWQICLCLWLTLSHTGHVILCLLNCFLRLNMAIQNSESNHHCDQSSLQEWPHCWHDCFARLLAHPEHMWAIYIIGWAYRNNFSYRADVVALYCHLVTSTSEISHQPAHT